MSGKQANIFDELFGEEEFAKKQAKKAEAAEKVRLATKDQTKAAKGAEAKGTTSQHTSKFTPVVDVTRPEKRAFDRISGTGRGKEVAKGGHGGWGKEIEKDEGEWDKTDVAKDIAEVKKEEKKESEIISAVETEKKVEEEEKKVPEVEPITLEEYEKSLASKKSKVQKKKKDTKAVESEIQVKDSKILSAGKVAKTISTAPISSQHKEDKKKKDGELTTEDFFVNVKLHQRSDRPPREGRGEGRGFGPREDRAPGFRGPRPDRTAAPATTSPDVQQQSINGELIYSRYVPGKPSASTPAPAHTAPQGAPQQRREPRDLRPRGPQGAPAPRQQQHIQQKSAPAVTEEAFPTLGGK